MSLSCLIIDDSRMIRRVAARIIRELGFETDEAPNAEDALALCEVTPPDVILVDWSLPKMNGLEFLKTLRKLPGGKTPKVIFCSAIRDIDKILDVLHAGADEYIMKPFDSDIITSKFAICGLLDGADRCAAA